MAKSIKGTKTEKNLLASFAGESQARNRYTFFASAAKKKGLEQISRIFLETAENEKEHAKVFFKYLEGGEVEITAAYPAGIIGDTRAILRLRQPVKTWNGQPCMRKQQKLLKKRVSRKWPVHLNKYPKSKCSMRIDIASL